MTSSFLHLHLESIYPCLHLSFSPGEEDGLEKRCIASQPFPSCWAGKAGRGWLFGVEEIRCLRCCWNIWLIGLVKPRLAPSWTNETMCFFLTLTCAPFFLHFSSLTKSEEIWYHLPPPCPSSPLHLLPCSFFPKDSPLSAPGAVYLWGGDEEERVEGGTGLFRFGRQQWTSVSADGLLQHMVPTCLFLSPSDSPLLLLPFLRYVSLFRFLCLFLRSLSLCHPNTLGGLEARFIIHTDLFALATWARHMQAHTHAGHWYN